MGSVYLESSGAINVSGEYGYGMNAWSNNASATGDVTIVLKQTGKVTMDNYFSSALYSLNNGLGNAIAISEGEIVTFQDEAYGVLATIDNGSSNAKSIVTLTDTSSIVTNGNNSRGAWAVNRGFGETHIESAGSVQTQGDESVGVFASTQNAGNASALSANLIGNGTIVTAGTKSVALHAEQIGTGAVSAGMTGGTSITTTGSLSDGILATGLGDVEVNQDSGAVIQASGAQSAGVSISAGTGARALINGTVTSTGEYGVGIAADATAGDTAVEISAETVVTGGWQSTVAGRGSDTLFPSAGVVIGAYGQSSLLNNGVITAGSDRAIAGITRGQGGVGNLTLDNNKYIIGFVELTDGGTNIFNNNNTGLFDIRHFADSDGDGIRDTKRVSISDFGASSSSFNNKAGATIRLAPVTGENNVDATDYYIPTTGFDSRALEASYYDLNRSAVVQGQFTNLGTFSNSGTIDLRGAAVGNTLVITSNDAAGGTPGNAVFVANGGTLLLNSVLNAGVVPDGQSGSYSDMLVVDSTQLGTAATGIKVTNIGGTGDYTPGNGIELVEVRDKQNSAAGVFTLVGDYTTSEGEQAVIGGAYAYTMFHGGVGADANDGNWYLRSALNPVEPVDPVEPDVPEPPRFHPGTPVYETYPQHLLGLIRMPSMQQRVGNRYWKEPEPLPAQETVFCKDPSQNFRCAITSEQAKYYANAGDGRAVIEGSAFWARVEGGYSKVEPAFSTSDSTYNSNVWKLQAGLDGLLYEGQEGSRLLGGINLNYGRARTNVSSIYGDGDMTTDGYGIGGTLTWLDQSGFYIDGQANLTWFNSDLNSDYLDRLANSNNGFGYALSIETGKKIDLDEVWTVTPQAQLIYTNVDFDTFTDPYGTRVSLNKGDSLKGRLGLSVDRSLSWQDKEGKTRRSHVYGIANLHYEFLDGTRVDVSGVKFNSRPERFTGGIGLGGSYNWDDDKYSIYGEVVANTAFKDFGKSFDIGGSLGLRVKW